MTTITTLLFIMTTAAGFVEAAKTKKPKIKTGVSAGSEEEGESKPLSTGAKIAIIVVCVVVFLVALFFVFRKKIKPWLEKRKALKNEENAENAISNESDPAVSEKQKHDLEAGSAQYDAPTSTPPYGYAPPPGPPNDAPMTMPVPHSASHAT